jgi:N-acetylglucosaminyldiphosphoundecaprenol N-acetyl-beta-D-mannosaminyltransferase
MSAAPNTTGNTPPSHDADTHPWVFKSPTTGLRLDLRRRVHAMLGLVFDEIDMAQTVAHVRRCVQTHERCFLSTVNLNFTITALSNHAIRHSLMASDLVVVDGMPLVWAAKAMGVPIQERVAGSDLFEALERAPMAAASHSAPVGVYFFGGEDGVAERASQALNARHVAQKTGLRCAGFASPGFVSAKELGSDARIDAINASKADLIAVSVGAAKGQAWILDNQDRLQAPVISYLGAVVNFVAGHVERAPVLMRRLGLEWLWRIFAEPALWRRYFNDGRAFASLLLQQVLPAARAKRSAQGAQTKHPPPTFSQHDDPQGHTVVRWSGHWQAGDLAPIRDAMAQALQAGRTLRWQWSDIASTDTGVIGLALLIAHWQGGALLIGDVPAAVQRQIAHAGAARLLQGQT